VKLTDFGRIGQLEAARQALEEAGEKGLSSRQIMEAAGTYDPSGGGNTQHFLCLLTSYCFIYEDDHRRRYYLDVERDATFNRNIYADFTFGDEEANDDRTRDDE
jgi:hypothetical protein